MAGKLDITNQKFGKLTAISFDYTKNNQSYWKCLCECGNGKTIRLGDLRGNYTKSCGCLHKERASKASKTHGLTNSTEYRIWQAIKTRCLNPNSNQYKDYGGRNITISENWKDNFEQFLNDMGKRPSTKHTIDRINNNLGYYKENCKWSTYKQQNNNKRSNVKIINTKTNKIFNTLIEASKSINMNRMTLKNQLEGVCRNKTDLRYFKEQKLILNNK